MEPIKNKKPAYTGKIADLDRSNNGIAPVTNKYQRLNKYDLRGDLASLDQNEIRAANQTGLEVAANGTAKALSTVVTMPTLGLVGSFESIVNAAGAVLDKGQSLITGKELNEDLTVMSALMGEHSYFLEWSDNITKYIGEEAPVYRSKYAQEKGILSSAVPFTEGSGAFWFEDFLGGAAFTVGAIATELTAQAAGSLLPGAGNVAAGVSSMGAIGRTGRNLFTTGSKFGKLFNTSGKVAQGAGIYRNALPSKFKQAGDIARNMVTGSMFEAGMEARGFIDEASKQEFAEFEKQMGRKATDEEKKEIMKEIKGTANYIFAGNMALVSASNWITLGNIFTGLKRTKVDELAGGALATSGLKGKALENAKKTVGNSLNDTPFVAAYKTWSKTKQAKKTAWSFAKPMLSEGLMEEGGQSFMSTAGMMYSAKKYSAEGAVNTYSLFDSLSMGLAKTLTDKDSQKEMFIGAMIGGGSSSVQNYKVHKTFLPGDYAQEKAKHEQAAELLNNTEVTIPNIQHAIRAQEINNQNGNNSDNVVETTLNNNEDFFSFASSRIRTGFGEDFNKQIEEQIDLLETAEMYNSATGENITEDQLEEKKEEFKNKLKSSYKSVEESLRLADQMYPEGSLDFREALAFTINRMNFTDIEMTNKVNELNKLLPNFNSQGDNKIKDQAVVATIKSLLPKFHKNSNNYKKTLKELYDLRIKDKAIKEDFESIEEFEEYLETLRKEDQKNVPPKHRKRVGQLQKEIADLNNFYGLAEFEFNALTSNDGQKKFKENLDEFLNEYAKYETQDIAVLELSKDNTKRDVAMANIQNRFGILRETTENKAFNEYANTVQEELEGLTNIDEQNELIDKKIKEAEERIKSSDLETKEKYEAFKAKLEALKAVGESIKEEIKKTEEEIKEASKAIPQGAVMFSPYQIFQLAQLETEQERDIAQRKISETDDVWKQLNFRVEDRRKGEEFPNIQSRGNQNIDIAYGITNGPNRGKGVYAYLGDTPVGILQDPNRFFEGDRLLDPISKLTDLRLINPAFVYEEDGKLKATEQGKEYQKFHLAANKNIWSKIYGGEKIITGDNIRENFFVRDNSFDSKSHRVVKVGSNQYAPTIEEFFSNKDELNIEFIVGNKQYRGIIIYNQATERMFLRNDEGITELTKQEEIDEVRKIFKKVAKGLNSGSFSQGKFKNKKGKDGVARAIFNNDVVIYKTGEDYHFVQAKQDYIEMNEEEIANLDNQIQKTVVGFEGNNDFDTVAKYTPVLGKDAGHFIPVSSGNNTYVQVDMVNKTRKNGEQVKVLRVKSGDNYLSYEKLKEGQEPSNLKYTIEDGEVYLFDNNRKTGKPIKKKLTYKLLEQKMNYVVGKDSKVLGIQKELSDSPNKLTLDYIPVFGISLKPKDKQADKPTGKPTEKTPVKEPVKTPATENKSIDTEVFLAQIREVVNEGDPTKIRQTKENLNQPNLAIDNIPLTEDQINQSLAIIQEYYDGLNPVATATETKPTVEKEYSEEALGFSESLLKGQESESTFSDPENQDYLKEIGFDGLDFQGAIELAKEIVKEFNNRKSDSNDIPFKVQENEATEIITVGEVKTNLKRIFGDDKFEYLDKIMTGIVNKGVTMGAFMNGVIYLSRNAEKGTEYHEAFHKIFRTYFNDSEIDRMYKIAQRVYGKPTKEDIKKLKEQSNIYTDFTNEELVDLWYEEKLADEFQKYSLKNTNPSSNVIKRFFDKLWLMIKSVFSDRAEMELYFFNINTGAYKNRTPKYKVSPLTFSIREINKDTDGNIMYGSFFNSGKSNKIINTIAANVISNLKTSNILVSNEAIEEEITKTAQRFSVENFSEELKALGLRDRVKLRKRLNEIQQALQEYTSVDPNGQEYKILDNKNREYVLQEVKTRIKIYDTDLLEDDIEEENELDETATLGNFDKSPYEFGGFKSLSKLMKQYISFVPSSEDFGVEGLINPDNEHKFNMTADGITIYNGLLRLLSNQNREDFLPKIIQYSKDNPNVADFKNFLFRDINRDLGTNYTDEELANLTQEELSESIKYTMLVSSFEKASMEFVTMLFDPETNRIRVLNANAQGVDKIQFERWKVAHGKTNMSTAYDVIQTINGLVKGTDENPSYTNLEDTVKKIKDQFSSIGIDLSPGYIRYNIIDYNFSAIESASLSDNQTQEEKDLYTDYLNFHRSFDDIDLFVSNDSREPLGALITANKQFEDDEAPQFGMFESVENEEGEELKLSGAKTTLMKMAESNAVFDETVIDSTFQNAEGKTIFNKIAHTYYTEHINKWKTSKNRREILKFISRDHDKQEALDMMKRILRAEKFIHDEYTIGMYYDILVNNPLVMGINQENIENEEYIDLIFDNLDLRMFDGIETRNINDKGLVDNYGAVREKSGAFKRQNQRGKLLLNLISFANSGKASVVNYINKGDKTKLQTRLFNIGVNAEKSTNYAVRLPVNEFSNEDGTANKMAVEFLKPLLKQEFDRIVNINEQYKAIEKRREELKNEYKDELVDVENWVEKTFSKLKKENPDDYNKLLKSEKEKTIDQYIKEEGFTIIEKYNKKEGDRGFNFFHFNPNSETDEFLSKLQENALSENPDFSSVPGLDAYLQDHLNNLYNEYKELIKEEGVELIKEDNETLKNNLLPVDYQNKDKTINEKALADFVFNDYLNTFAFTNIMDGDYAMEFKNAIDVIKRNSGKVAAGNSMFGETTKTAVIESFEVRLSQEESERTGVNPNKDIDRSDAQSIGGIDFLIKYMKSNVKFNSEVKRIYKKIKRGIPLSQKEAKYLIDMNADLRPRKIVQRSMDSYIKTSLHTITRSITSQIKDKSKAGIKMYNQLWDKYDEAQDPFVKELLLEEIHSLETHQEGKEKLHSLLQEMERKDIGFISMDSAIKTARKNVGRFNERTQKWESNPYEIFNSDIREQVNTDGNKFKVNAPTQKIGTVWSEQDETIDVEVLGSTVKMKEAVSAYKHLLAHRVKMGFIDLKQVLIETKGTIDKPLYDALYDSISASLNMSNEDPYLKELFVLDDDGKPKYNWNLAAVNKKFQNMYLSFVSKGTLKQKASGRKYTLISDIGYNIMREVLDTKTKEEHKNLEDNLKEEYVFNEDRDKYIKYGRVVQTKDYNKLSKDEKKNFIGDRLRHRLKDTNDNTYYSEAVVSLSVLDRFNIKKGEEITIPAHVAKQIGVRIPTEGKHSMIVLKIVDTLPLEYGNGIIVPYENVLLSGADFDVDALYTRAYTEVEKRVYGDYLREENDDTAVDRAWVEFNNYKKTTQVYKVSKSKLYNTVAKINKLKSEIAKQITKVELENLDVFAGIDLSSDITIEEINEIIDEVLDKKVKEKLIGLRQEFLAADSSLHKIILKDLGLPSDRKEFAESKYAKQALKNKNSYQQGKFSQINPLTKNENNNLMLDLETIFIHNKANKAISAKETNFSFFENLEDTLGLSKTPVITRTHDPASKSKISKSIDEGATNIGPVALFNIAFQLLNSSNINVKNKYTILGKKDFTVNKDKANIVNDKGERINEMLSSVLSGMTDNAKEQFAAKFNLTIDTIAPVIAMLGMGIDFNTAVTMVMTPSVREFSKKIALRNSTVVTNQESKDSKPAEELIKDLIDKYKKEITLPVDEITPEYFRDNVVNSVKEVNDPNINYMAIKEFEKAYEIAQNLRHLSKAVSLIKGLKTTNAENEAIYTSLAKIGFEITGDNYSNTGLSQVPTKHVFDESINNLKSNDLFMAHLKAFNSLEHKGSLFFLSKTPMFKAMRDILHFNIKEGSLDYAKNIDKVEQELISFLQIKAYQNLSGNKPDFEQLIFTPYLHDKILELGDSSNPLIKFLKLKSYEQKNGLTVHTIEGNTRTKSSPEYQEELMVGYKNLFKGTKAEKELGKLLFDYTLVKDNMQYKNAGIIKQIAPYFLTKTSKSLDAVIDLFNNERQIKDLNGDMVRADFNTLFGVSQKQLIREFTEKFLRDINNTFSFTPSNKVESFYDKSNQVFTQTKNGKQINNFSEADGFTIDIKVGLKTKSSSKFNKEDVEIAKANTKILAKGNVFKPNYKKEGYANTFQAPLIVALNSKKDKKLFIIDEVTFMNKETKKAETAKLSDLSSFKIDQALSVKYKEVGAIGSKNYGVWAADIATLERLRANKEPNTEVKPNNLNIQAKGLIKDVNEQKEAATESTNNLSDGQKLNNLLKQSNKKEEVSNLTQGQKLAAMLKQSNNQDNLTDGQRLNMLLNQSNKKGNALSIENESQPKTISETKLMEILDFLKSKFGIDYRIDRTLEHKGMFLADGVVLINPDKVTLDTPFHEYLHPFVYTLRSRNPRLYKALARQAKSTEINEEAYYKEYRKQGLDEKTIEQLIIDEKIVHAIAMKAAGNYTKPYLRKLIDKFIDFIKTLFSNTVKAEELSETTTIQEIADLMTSRVKIETNYKLDDVNSVITLLSKC